MTLEEVLMVGISNHYVLGTMFYRFISENLTNYINEGEAWQPVILI